MTTSTTPTIKSASESPGFQPWLIEHLQLLDPLPSLEAAPDSAGKFLVLWCGDVPLGHLWLRAKAMPIPPQRLASLVADAIAPAVGEQLLPTGFREELPMPSFLRQVEVEVPPLADLLAHDRPLDALATSHKTSTPSLPVDDRRSVTVIVCTRDRPDDLARCLASLDRLDPRPSEVLVVDNAPDAGATREVVAHHPQAIYIPEPRPGLSVARNTGIRRGSGQILAFTDDDVEVHPRWVEALRCGFAFDDVGVVTGLVLPAALDTPARLWFQGGEGSEGWSYRKRLFDRPYFQRLRNWGVPVWQLGAGANMAIRRDIIDEVGLFDERLGAGASGCSEDSEFWYRVLAMGKSCLYFPEAVVHHYHRRDEEVLRHQIRQYLRGHIAALFVQFWNHGHLGNLVRALGLLPVHFVALAARTVLYGNPQPTLGWQQLHGYFQGFLYLPRLGRSRYEPLASARSPSPSPPSG